MDVYESTPFAVPGLTSMMKVVAGEQHTCALRQDGTAYCWGDPSVLGTANPQLFGPPEPVVGITDAVDIDAFAATTCTSNALGAASCWGNVAYVTCEPLLMLSPQPTPVSGFLPVTHIAAGNKDVCGLNQGNLWCRGRDYCGGLDGGTPAVSPLVEALQGVVSSRVLYAVLVDGTVQCSGENQFGQLGDGTQNSRTVFGPVLGITSATGVAVGGYHACAALKDGSARCWGSNENGEVGTGVPLFTNADTPVAVTGVQGVVSMAAGCDFTCALIFDGSVMCWGGNDFGQLGRGATSLREVTPAPVQW